jgi:hypothetical protein
MYQIAATAAHASRNGYDYRIPVNTLNTGIWPNTHHYFKNLRLMMGDIIVNNQYNEVNAHEYIPIPKHFDDIELNGYFQSFKHFADKIEEVRYLFDIPFQTVKGALVVHFRGGDYADYPEKHPIMPKKYYDKAMTLLNKLDKDVKSVSIISDSPEMAKKIFPHHNVTCSANPIDDFYKMCMADYLITANSSYSLLAGILNRNPEKVVISPHSGQWYGKGNSHLCTCDMVPDYFHQLKF